MSNLLKTFSIVTLVSRFEHLATETSIVIDSAVHAAGEILGCGLIMGKTAAGKYRAYGEAVVKTGGAFSTAAATFTLDPALAGSALIGFIRVGDVIESTAGAALGTVATFNPVTGVGTLSGNSASNLAAGQSVRVAASVCQLSGLQARLLKSPVTMGSSDSPGVGFIEGYFKKSITQITAAAQTSMGAIDVSADEIRVK